MATACSSARPAAPTLVAASGDRELFDRLYLKGRPEQVVGFLVRAEANPNSVVSCELSWQFSRLGRVLERINETLRIVRGQAVPGAPDELECLSDLNRLHDLTKQRYFIADHACVPA